MSLHGGDHIIRVAIITIIPMALHYSNEVFVFQIRIINKTKGMIRDGLKFIQGLEVIQYTMVLFINIFLKYDYL
jgi:hypothetical protein